MNCTNCGKELSGGIRFCDGCGAPVASERGASAQGPAVSNEAKGNKTVFILSYLGILFFLPLVSCPESQIGRFHANQGLVLLITSIVGQIAVSILSGILLAISWRLWALISLLSWAWALAIIALVIIGMVNSNKGLQKPLPVIGSIKIIK